MFVDKVQVKVVAGDGGNGVISFRHEKFVDRGGPDGGDGGKGGDVVVVASRNQNTLAAFRYKKLLEAQPGEPGSKRKRHGKSAKDLDIAVPVGTVIIAESGEVLADLTEDNQRVVIAEGGQGGFGNAHFVSSRRQAPRLAEKGEKGEKADVFFELKMIADVGLVGLPNAGKSTLLATISNARPEIGDYPFTTIRPNLGVVDIDNKTSLLFADIPGLIEGASEGKGLGDEFLRHVERTSVLVHVIDAYEDVGSVYGVIQKELGEYSTDLSKRPQIIALNKTEGLNKKELAAKLKQLKTVAPRGVFIMAISAKTKDGVQDLLYRVKDMAAKQQAKTIKAEKKLLPVLQLKSDDKWDVIKEGDIFVITGKKIERFGERTDFASQEGVQRLRVIMKKMGIGHELARRGANPGDKIKIGSQPFRW